MVETDFIFSTLDYMNRARNIKNKPEVNQKIDKMTMLKDYSNEIAKLQSSLAAAREGTGFYVIKEEYDGMLSKIASDEKNLALLTKDLANAESVNAEVTAKMDEFKELYLAFEAKLKETEQHLQKTAEELALTESSLEHTKGELQFTNKAYNKLEKHQEVVVSQNKKLVEDVVALDNDTKLLHSKIGKLISLTRISPWF